jgi:rhamnose transport system substrate-binding protein
MFASLIARGQLKPEVGKTVKIGRLGDMLIEAENNTFLKNLLVFDKSNIEKYAAQF